MENSTEIIVCCNCQHEHTMDERVHKKSGAMTYYLCPKCKDESYYKKYDKTEASGEVNLSANFINEFVDRIINGSTGFKTWEEREFVCFTDRELGIAEFVIRCLANPLCDGSRQILRIITERHMEVSLQKQIVNSGDSTLFEITNAISISEAELNAIRKISVNDIYYNEVQDRPEMSFIGVLDMLKYYEQIRKRKESNGADCKHEFVAREYTSQPHGTCVSCGKTILN